MYDNMGSIDNYASMIVQLSELVNRNCPRLSHLSVGALSNIFSQAKIAGSQCGSVIPVLSYGPHVALWSPCDIVVHIMVKTVEKLAF